MIYIFHIYQSINKFDIQSSIEKISFCKIFIKQYQPQYFAQIINLIITTMLKNLLSIILVVCFLEESNNQVKGKLSPYPKILWGYWHQGEQKASTFTKLCINNQRKYAEASGWKFNFLGPHNLHEYLDVDRIYQLWRINGLMVPQVVADLIRMSLLLKYGGMWVDANSFFIEDFSWIDNIHRQPYIYHKFQQWPEVILGSSTYNYIESGTIRQTDYTHKTPNIQDWFMIAVPNSLFFREVMSTIQKVLSMGRQESNKYYSALGVNNSVGHSDYFLMSNYIFETILKLQQLKYQKQPQSNLPAMKFYKIWNIEAYKPIFTFLNVYKTTTKMFLSDMVVHNITTYRQILGGLRYQIKLNSAQYKYINSVLDNFSQNYCLGHISQIKQGSVFSQYLLKHLESISNNQKIQGLLLTKQERNCQNIIEQHGSILFLIFQIVLFITFLYAMFKTTQLEEYYFSQKK